MKKFAVLLIAVALLAVLAWPGAPPVKATAESGLPLTVQYTLEYSIELPWQGNYYPGSSSIRVEMYNIPMNTAHQTVQASLNQGSIQTINGKDAWVIDTTTIYTNNIYTGTFVVTVDLGSTGAIPHQPLTEATGEDVSQYLLPDEFVTMSPDVVNQAQLLLSEAGDDTPTVIAKFVDWIKKNVSYDDSKWAAREAGADSPDLTDSQMLSLRSGVCTDYANLFMGFCRSVGIPARCVLGHGLSSSEADLYQPIQSSASHAWTEVWIPNYGWLTVDPTWGDIGDSRKIATARYRDETWHWWTQDIPPGSAGVVNGTESYSATLTGWDVINEVTPITLTEEDTGTTLEFNITNSSPIPFLDNIAVQQTLLQGGSWSEWFGVSSEITFLNPGETYTYSVAKEDGVGYYVWSKQAGDGLTDWQYPGGTTTYTTSTPDGTTTYTTSTPNGTITPTGPTTPPELMDWLPYAMVAIIIVAIVGSVSSARKRRKPARTEQPTAPEPEPEAAAEAESEPAQVLAICPKCKARVPATSKFCTECGADLKPRKRKS